MARSQAWPHGIDCCNCPEVAAPRTRIASQHQADTGVIQRHYVFAVGNTGGPACQNCCPDDAAIATAGEVGEHAVFHRHIGCRKAGNGFSKRKRHGGGIANLERGIGNGRHSKPGLGCTVSTA